MSYKPIPDIPKSKKAMTGRKFQRIGSNKVKKYAFSPFTAKPKQRYTFYADVEMVRSISSPSGKDGEPHEVKWVTIPAWTGTYLEFRDQIEVGNVQARLQEIVENMGGEGILQVGYWRNRGERSEE